MGEIMTQWITKTTMNQMMFPVVMWMTNWRCVRNVLGPVHCKWSLGPKTPAQWGGKGYRDEKEQKAPVRGWGEHQTNHSATEAGTVILDNYYEILSFSAVISVFFVSHFPQNNTRDIYVK